MRVVRVSRNTTNRRRFHNRVRSRRRRRPLLLRKSTCTLGVCRRHNYTWLRNDHLLCTFGRVSVMHICLVLGWFPVVGDAHDLTTNQLNNGMTTCDHSRAHT
jgi:hypothetical protein